MHVYRLLKLLLCLVHVYFSAEFHPCFLCILKNIGKIRHFTVIIRKREEYGEDTLLKRF